MDVFQDYILITYRPFDIHIFYVKVSGELSPVGTPSLQVIEKHMIDLYLMAEGLFSQNF